MTKAWLGDWYERIMQRVHDRGFETVTAFVNEYPTISLLVLADELGKDDVAASQVERIFVREAEATGTIERCARDLLVRNLYEQLPEGWHTEWDDDAAFRRAGAYGNWCSAFPQRYQDSYRQVGEALKVAPISKGWLPSGPDDPVLLEIFKHWENPA